MRVHGRKLFAVLLALSGPSLAEEQPTMTLHRKQVCPADPSGWCAAVSTNGHFSVLLPIPFNDFSIAAKDTSGRPLASYTVGGLSVEGIKFTAYCMYNQALPATAETLEKVVAALGEAGTLVTQTKLGGNGGYDLHLLAPDSSAYFHLVREHGALYEIIIEFPNTQAELAAKLAPAVFASFKTIGPPLSPAEVSKP